MRKTNEHKKKAERKSYNNQKRLDKYDIPSNAILTLENVKKTKKQTDFDGVRRLPVVASAAAAHADFSLSPPSPIPP